MALGCAVGLLTFLVHGVLDMFLEYSATNLLLWALIGALGSLPALGGSHRFVQIDRAADNTQLTENVEVTF